MSEELKRCPHCGGDEVAYGTFVSPGGMRVSVICPDCDASVARGGADFDEAFSAAAEAWNRRAVDVDALLALADEMEADADEWAGLWVEVYYPDDVLELVRRIREACGVVA